MHRNFRKPLVIAAPKIGLKHPVAVSSVSEMQPGTNFKPIIEDNYVNAGNAADRVIFCSGKVSFDIRARLEKAAASGIRVIRLEELAPFPVA